MSVKKEKVNPYDWVSPVKEANLFAGRKNELEIAEKELRFLASGQGIPQMVAFAGERRVGKTSLLLRIEELCDHIRILPVRLSLTLVHSLDPWEFWRELFHQAHQAGGNRDVLPPDDQMQMLGFDNRKGEEIPGYKYLRNRQFESAYDSHAAHSGPEYIALHTICHDLHLLLEATIQAGYFGILFMFDEAHLLVQEPEDKGGPSLLIKQQLRHAVQEVGRCGVAFAGEPHVARLVTSQSEPLFGQGRVVPVKNFANRSDILECKLLPLNEDERRLVSPMTGDYLAKLSQGKPNQIRLICYHIYERYLNGEQKSLDISIEALENVIDYIAAGFVEYDLKDQVDTIRRLSSIDLETLYNMTRYPGWSVSDIIELDESF